MEYYPKKVAELIADRRSDELAKALQPRLRKIAEIVSTVRYGLDIGNTIGQFFADYVSFGAYDAKVPFHVYSHDEGIDVSYCSEDMHLMDSTIVPVEFATCEDKDLKEAVLSQIYVDLTRHAEGLWRKFFDAWDIRNRFSTEYGKYICSNAEKDTKGEK